MNVMSAIANDVDVVAAADGVSMSVSHTHNSNNSNNNNSCCSGSIKRATTTTTIATRGRRGGVVCLKADGNFVFEELLNSISHALGFVAAVVGAILLVGKVTDEANALPHTNTACHVWGALIYSFSLLFLYISSTLYHRQKPIPFTYSLTHSFIHSLSQ